MAERDGNLSYECDYDKSIAIAGKIIDLDISELDGLSEYGFIIWSWN